MRAGLHIFSPIAHSAPIARYGLPTTWDYWERVDRRHLEICDELLVLMLPGWQESRGVQAEIRIAAELGKPVRYLDPATLPTRAHVASGHEAGP